MSETMGDISMRERLDAAIRALEEAKALVQAAIEKIESEQGDGKDA